jgi:hypothetical protein
MFDAPSGASNCSFQDESEPIDDLRTTHAMTARTHLARQMDRAALVLALLYLLLALASRGSFALYLTPNLATGLTLLALAVVPGFWFFRHARTTPADRFPMARLLLWAALFRALGLVGVPLWEDDYFRYLWDGYRFFTDGTPYTAAPGAWFGDASVPAVMQRVLDSVNYPDIPTVYGPVTQLVFLAAHAVAPGAVWPLQALLAAADLALVVLLSRLAAPHWVWLYAASPLVFKEIVLSAHPDGLMALALVAALWAHSRGHGLWVAFAAALAVAAKIVALVAVPFLLARLGARAHLAFAALLGALYLPFVVHGDGGMAGLFAMARDWEFNAALYALVAPALGAPAAKFVLGGAFVLVCAGYWLPLRLNQPRLNQPHLNQPHLNHQPPTALPNLAALFGGLLVIAPVVNPWYALWVLPFAAIHPARWAWVGSVALLASYVRGPWLADLPPYVQPAWLHFTLWGVIALALARDLRRPWPASSLKPTPVRPPCPAPA